MMENCITSNEIVLGCAVAPPNLQFSAKILGVLIILC